MDELNFLGADAQQTIAMVICFVWFLILALVWVR